MGKDSKNIERRKLWRVDLNAFECGQEKDNGLLVIERIGIGDIRCCGYHAECVLQILHGINARNFVPMM